MPDDPKGIPVTGPAPAVAPPEPVPETVPAEDFRKLQSVFDKKILELTQTIDGLKTGLVSAQTDLELAKSNMTADAAAKLAKEKDLQKREIATAAERTKLAADSKQLCVKRLVHQAKAEHGVDVKPEDLEKLSTEVDIELAVLRQVAAAKPQPKAPDVRQLNVGGSTQPGGTVADPIAEVLKQEQMIRKR